MNLTRLLKQRCSTTVWKYSEPRNRGQPDILVALVVLVMEAVKLSSFSHFNLYSIENIPTFSH